MAIVEKPLGLVADIGGTNGRFALKKSTAGSRDLFEHRQYKLDDFDNFNAMLEHYLDDCWRATPLDAVIAVAGPVQKNHCSMTNRGWLVDGKQLQQDNLVGSCQLLNDFDALARALPFLGREDLMQIGGQGRHCTGSRLVIGPGTGLGAAFLIEAGSSPVPLAGEGGHMAFAPVDDLDWQILAWFGKKFQRVSVERLLSGEGLQDLHVALARIEGRKTAEMSASEIMSRGLSGHENERATLMRFCAILGSYAGDMALVGGSWGGVYIGGGIAPRMPELLAASPFRQRFEAKGRFAEKMRDVPCSLITHKEPALIGAASLL